MCDKKAEKRDIKLDGTETLSHFPIEKIE